MERGFLLAFFFCNLKAYLVLTENVYSIDFLQGKAPDSKKVHLLRVLTYTAIIFFGLKMDLEKFKEGAVQRHPGFFAYLMVIYVSGLVCLGFIVNMIFSR